MVWEGQSNYRSQHAGVPSSYLPRLSRMIRFEEGGKPRGVSSLRQTNANNPIHPRLVRRPCQAATMSPEGKKEPVASASSADVDLDKILNREANALQRDIEVDRILKAFKLK